MTREIILDTETTGLNPAEGDRIVEIGALEMVNHAPTGRTCHLYINPECEIGADAVAIHGLTNEILKDKPVFAEIVDAFIEFIADSQLVIHNAPFDMGFINAELKRLGREELPMERAIDTLSLARRKFPGSQASLDALCRRFNIDNSHRTLHGAMIDTDLLADVYVELIGGRQPGLSFTDAAPGNTKKPDADKSEIIRENTVTKLRPPRPYAPTEEEIKTHRAFIETLNDPLWKKVI